MKYESGRSMIEMMGVLAIMGVITVAAVAAISSAKKTQKRNAFPREILVFFLSYDCRRRNCLSSNAL